eukprot:10525264-Lingulodinium_polyedra.AAC.1
MGQTVHYAPLGPRIVRCIIGNEPDLLVWMPKPGAKEIEARDGNEGDPDEGPPPLVDEDGLPAEPRSAIGLSGGNGACPQDGG